MYNICKLRHSDNLLVEDLIRELQKENPKAKVTICGDDNVYIHVELDNSTVTLDNEDLLSDAYPEESITSNIVPKIESKGYISQYRSEEIIHSLSAELIKKERLEYQSDINRYLGSLGIQENELDILGFTASKRDEGINLDNETSYAILDQFEQVLDAVNIKLPDEFRPEEHEEDGTEACIYGETYTKLHENVKDILLRYKEYVLEYNKRSK